MTDGKFDERKIYRRSEVAQLLGYKSSEAIRDWERRGLKHIRLPMNHVGYEGSELNRFIETEEAKRLGREAAEKPEIQKEAV